MHLSEREVEATCAELFAQAEGMMLAAYSLHECRHTFAGLAIAAGVNIGTVSAAMGHASVKITWHKYHHPTPGTVDEAAALIQAYIDKADTA